ncbi:MAG: hypothetical protein JNM36_07210 [Chitinophagales bacterium]|nr:hypothetical protein [Chitinophagales bacterium]
MHTLSVPNSTCWLLQPSCAVPICSCDVQVFHSIADLPAWKWDGLLTDKQYFLRTNYLRIIEQSCPHIEPRYVLFSENNEVVAVAVFQLLQLEGSDNFRFKKNISTQKACLQPTIYFQNLATDWVNNLSLRVLVNGNGFITGEHAFYYNTLRLDGKTAFAGLQKAINTILAAEKQGEKKVQLVLVKDFEQQHLPFARQLATYNFHEVAGQPNMIVSLRPEWQSFDDYMAAMSAKYRTRTKGILKKGAALERRTIDKAVLAHELPAMYAYYRDVCLRADFNLAVCTPEYFAQCLEQLPEQFHILGYYLNGNLVGFISYFLTPHDIEAHFIGYDFDLNHQYPIYNTVLLDLVKIGIEHRKEQLHLGRTATEIKSTVGAVPTQQNAFVQHLNPIVNRVVARLVNSLRNDNWVQRHPFKE